MKVDGAQPATVLGARALALLIPLLVVAAVFAPGHDGGSERVDALLAGSGVVESALTCVGVVSRRGRLIRRALVTLVVGLGTSCAAATLVAVVLDLTDLMPSDFALDGSALGGLTSVNAATVGVAFAAGVAGILALETRTSSAVGVAISVTTIPAAAYLGVAVGVGEASKAWGALAVLGVNVAVLLVAGTLTLLAQRRWGRASTKSTMSLRSVS